jgi:hypothetical protein
LTRLPLRPGTTGFSGFGLGNLAKTGVTGGCAQNVVLSDAHIYRPSKPETSACARTCVQVAPKLEARYVVSQLELDAKPVAWQRPTMAAGRYVGASLAASWAIDSAATHREQFPSSPVSVSFASKTARIWDTADEMMACDASSVRLTTGAG